MLAIDTSEAQMDANETLLEREWDGRPAGAEVVASARLHYGGYASTGVRDCQMAADVL